MKPCEMLYDLEEPMARLCDGVTAVWAVYLALEKEGSGLAKGLRAVWVYLDETSRGVRSQYYTCLEQMGGCVPASVPK